MSEFPADLHDRLEAAWERSDRIFSLLAPDAWLQRPIALRQPFIFYLGHLPAFAWNQVCRGVLGRPSFNAAFDLLFERGIDPVGDDYRPTSVAWPTVEEVLAYRDRVRDALRGTFDEVLARAATDPLAERGRIYQLAIEHELMHHETLLYMVKRLDDGHKIRPGWLPPFVTSGAARPGAISIPAGPATLGASFDRLAFGWDNEFPEHPVEVAAFTVDATPVTNAEFLEFLEAGGYDRRAAWTDEGWAWKERACLRHPDNWTRDGGRWLYHTLFDAVPLDEVHDWPVYVSWAEASAYARWKGSGLPTEAEFHRAAYGTPSGQARSHPWGEGCPGPEHGSFDFRHWAPTPAGSHPAGASAWGVHELVGNGWEWTASVFEPYPGFQPYMRTYPGYSADFFDGKHYVMLGGSWATDAALVRRSFRNWFQPHYPYVLAKFRCVVGD
ncbi:MAG: ergothioneine biosynthesis protein EgtB [Gemmatimonadales bacterium]|nr:ergothioneine biosynthesis protein EgtB [Gemmatimonadales bacterium]